jgi:hypothetical protein
MTPVGVRRPVLWSTSGYYIFLVTGHIDIVVQYYGEILHVVYITWGPCQRECHTIIHGNPLLDSDAT